MLQKGEGHQEVTGGFQGKCSLPGTGCKLHGTALTEPTWRPVTEMASVVTMTSVVFIASFEAVLMTVQPTEDSQAQGNGMAVIHQMTSLRSLKRENIKRVLE